MTRTTRKNPYSYVTDGGVSNVRVTVDENGTLASLVDRFGEPVQLDTSVDEYHAAPKKTRAAIKKELPYFVGGTLKNRKRHDSNVTSRTLLTLDIEEDRPGKEQPPHPSAVVQSLKKLGAEGWVYTTVSHTPERPRYRVVLPLGEAITEDIAATLEASTLQAAAKLGIADWTRPESSVLSQPMYAPAQLKGGEFLSKYMQGKAWRTVAAKAPKDPDGVAPMPDRPTDALLAAIQRAGLYLGPKKGHPGMHFITCPFADQHGAVNETQTVYYEAHHDGNPRAAVKCFDTEPDEDGKPHLTIGTLTQWLRDNGYLTKDQETAETAAVLEEPESFFRRTAIADMLDTEPVPLEFAINGLVPRGMVTVLAGPGGVSKSALALRLLLAASTGSPFGPFKVPGAMRCLYVSYEDDRSDFQRRLHTMFDALADSADGLLYDMDDVRRNLFIDAVAGKGDAWLLMQKADRFGTPTATERVAWLRETLRQHAVRLLVLDPAAFTHRLEENDPGDMAAFMQMLGALASDTGCAIVLLHHLHKSAAWMELDGINQGSLRGASSLADNARSVAVMVSMSKKDAPRFGLPDTDETVSTYAVVKHVKHNHSASLGVHVFERKGPLLVPRQDIQRLDEMEVKERQVTAKASRESKRHMERALRAVNYLMENESVDEDGRTTMSTNQIRETVFNGDPATKKILEVAVELDWIENLSTGQGHKWAVTEIGMAAVREAGSAKRKPSK